MAEQTFSSPGFFDSEVVAPEAAAAVTGVPAGVIGSSMMGPAFVPVTVGNFAEFVAQFGSLDPNYMAPYAVAEFLRSRSALTFVRTLGAGKNSTSSDILTTETYGTTTGAGFIIRGSQAFNDDKRQKGCVQFIAAKHFVSSAASVGYPEFSANSSYNLTSSFANIIRGIVLTATGTRIQVMDYDQFYSSTTTADDLASIGTTTGAPTYLNFKLVVSSSSQGFGNTEGKTGIKIYTASLDPTSDNYIQKILNTDPYNFQKEEHLLLAHFPVEDEIAAVSTDSNSVAVLSGSSNTNSKSGQTFIDLFGRFDSRYTTPRTTSFISQPFSQREYDLFHFETISDGANANTRFKISINSIRRSDDVNNLYGTFNVQLRDFNDTDANQVVLEQFGPCDLNPTSPNYIAKVIGDNKVFYNFDAESSSDRRLITSGRYPNASRFIRIVMNSEVERGVTPNSALPFGFRGVPTIKTSDSLTDSTRAISSIVGTGDISINRTAAIASSNAAILGSIVPPLPLRFKVTRGEVNSGGGFVGQPGAYELADPRLYWGVKFQRVPLFSTTPTAVLASNGSNQKNETVDSYTKFLGIYKMDSLVTGSGADIFNNNKFTLARVALSINKPAGGTVTTAVNSFFTGSADEIMREAAYIRNASPSNSDATVVDGADQRITIASLVSLPSSVYFNTLQNYNKFTNIFYGGFDGTNILDKDMALMNDKSTSSESGGKAVAGLNIGLSTTYSPGVGANNGYVQSYQVASSIIMDPSVSRINIIAIPGIKDSFVTDFVSQVTEDYSKAIYLMDIPSYDDQGSRLFTYNIKRPDTNNTINTFAGRAYNNSYVATYYPDVSVVDQNTGRPVQVAASVAALSALGFNDSVSFPWFAPAGFNRGALENFTNVAVRLNSADRDKLYTNRINPIASFPNAGFVIFGQKTLQMARSSLDRVNVRRMLLEVKRIASTAALNLVFEQNNASTRADFVSRLTPSLSLIQSQQGVDQFKIICDATNNTQDDINNNRLNCKIIVAPTRAVEFIVVNFVVDSTGVTFA